MARATRSRHVWTPLLPIISDRNRNKSKISEFNIGASQNSEANHASFTSRRLCYRRHPEYWVSGGDISLCRLGIDLRGVPMVEQPLNPPPHLEPTHSSAICREIGERLRLVLDHSRSPLPPGLRGVLDRFGEMDAPAHHESNQAKDSQGWFRKRRWLLKLRR